MSTRFSPPSGPTAGSFKGLHHKRKFLAFQLPSCCCPLLRGLFVFCVLLASTGLVEAQATPFTLRTFQANNGELITRSRTVKLTIDASSSQGSISKMRLGDSARQEFGPIQSYRTSTVYAFPENATGRHLIAVQFQDSRGNLSGQYNLLVDIIPDLPVSPPLTRGATPKLSLRRGNFSSVELAPAVTDPAEPIVQMSTAAGEVLVQLYPVKAPQTVANFLKYVDSNLYDDSFIHRSVPGFIIQGGGHFVDIANNNSISAIGSFGAVLNEPGDSNTRGTIAMAKVDGDPNSATNQWFFNLADNSSNLDSQNEGFTVFGKVLDSSMGVVDSIAALPVSDQSTTFGFDSLPVFRLPGNDQSLELQDLVLVNETSRYRFSVIKSVPSVKATIINNFLVLEPQGKPTSSNASIMIRAVTPDGRTLDFPVVADVGTNHPMLAGGIGTRKVRATEDEPVDISIPVTNPDNSPLEWNIEPQPSKGSCELLPQTRPGTRVIRYTPGSNQNGTDNFSVEVFDDNVDPQKRGMDQLAIQLQIAPVNDTPNLTAPAILAVSAARSIEFDVTLDDAETLPANLLLTGTVSGAAIVRGSLSILGEGATRKVAFLTNPVTAPSAASVTLTVNDGTGKRRSVRIPVTVSPAL